MIKDRTIVCPKCGSKNISKKCPAIIGNKNNNFIKFKGYYYCRDCKEILRVRDMLPFYLFKKIN